MFPERAAEEERGLVRWLRPGYQRGRAGLVEQSLGLDISASAETAKSAETAAKRLWPRRTSERIQAVRAILADTATPQTARQVAAHFTRAPLADVTEMLATLGALGYASSTDGSWFSLSGRNT